MSKRINSISITKFMTHIILLTYILSLQIPSAAGRGQTIPAISGLHGGIGMGTWDTKAEFRDILVQTSDGKTLFQPYFTNGLDSWQRGGGEWTVVSGVLNQNSRAINCQIICGENTWTDYTYSLKARRTEGTEGFLIIFAAQDSKNLYWWNIGGWDNTRTAIEKMTQNNKREIPGTAVDLRIETGIWYDIKIAINGDTADCYFNGQLITRITQDKGSSSLPDAGPPTVVNNSNGPEPVTSTGGISSGRGNSPRSSFTRSGTSVPVPEITAVSPAPRLDDPTSWVPKANGCLIEQTSSRIHIVGTNNIDGWGNGNGITTTRFLTAGSFYVTVDFVVPKFSGSGDAIVYLRAKSTTDNGKMLAILFQPKAGTYQVQGWGVDGAPNTFSQTSLQKLGDEDKAFHRMKLKYDAGARIAAGWIDDKFIGMLDYTLTDPVKFELLSNTASKGMQIDLYFDNLYFTSNISEAPPTPARPASEVSTMRSSGTRSLPTRSGGPTPTADEVINKVLIPASPVQSPELDNKTETALRGGIGMGTWSTKAEFRDILVQTSNKNPFRSYFTNGLDGWQITGGQWTEASGVLSQSSRNTNCQIICGNNTWTNYIYSLKARRIEGTEGFLIIFAAQDGKNLYWWNIGGWANTRTAIERMTRGSKREIPGTAVNLRVETGTWYDIKISVHGDTADCYFNDSLITSITQDKGTSTLPDAGPPMFGNNGIGTEPAGTTGRGGSMQFTTITPTISETSPTPKMDDPSSWVPIANGCLIQHTGNKIQITGTNNIDGWGHGNGVISTSAVPTGDFYATVNFIVHRFSGPGNARVYFRVISANGNGKMAAVVYDPKADTFQIQGWGVNGEPNTITQPVQKAGNNMMYRWLTLQYDSKNKTISSTAASNRYLGTIDYDLSDPVRFELLTDADTKGMQIDVEFNNFSVTTDRIPATPDRITGGIPEQSTTRNWKSPNGKYGVRILENLVVTGHGDGARGPVIFRRMVTYVTGLAVDPNGTTSKQWEWTEPQPPRDTSSSYSSYITLQVSDVLVGDSGNRFVLLGRFNNINSTQLRAFQRVIVILDNKGKTLTEVIADDWLKVLGSDGEITSDKPAKLNFLDNEKILEIKLASGKTAHVNTDSGELSIKDGEADTRVQENPGTPALEINEQTQTEVTSRNGIKPVEHKELLDILEQELKVNSTVMQELVNKFSQFPKQQKLETAAYCLKENKYAGLLLWQMGRDNQLQDKRLVPYIIEVMPKLPERDLMYAASVAYFIPDINFVEPLLEYVITSDAKKDQVVGGQMMHYSAFESAAIALSRITGGELGKTDIKKSRPVQIQEWRDAWPKVRQELMKEIHPVAHQELLDFLAKADEASDKNKYVETFDSYKLNDKLETVAYVIEKGLYPDSFFAFSRIQDKRLVPFIAAALQDSNGLKVLCAAQLARQNPDPSLLPLFMKYVLDNNYGKEYRYSVGQRGAGERIYVNYQSVFGIAAQAIYAITNGKIGSQSYTNIKQEIPENERKDLIEKWRKIYDESLKKDYEQN